MYILTFSLLAINTQLRCSSPTFLVKPALFCDVLNELTYVSPRCFVMFWLAIHATTLLIADFFG